ncbi:MAG TPA: hypothetical protein VEL79_20005 [Vicinamibacterales bacterium]|nr:hypothetical protein [Vicinamibacterales bacterium]
MKLLTLPIALALTISLSTSSSDKDKQPKLSIKANPAMAFSPARVVFTADITGGPNDFEEFYCPSIQWEWGDGTESDATADCEPYQAGKSEIKRRFTADRVYRSTGEYRVQLRLKKHDKVIAAASTTVKIRPGLGDPGGG